MTQQEITLRVPGRREYALVLRLALGGVAILKDLDVGALDDLRSASDEAVDCLLHQGREVSFLTLTACDCGPRLTVRICAEFAGTACAPVDAEESDISRAVLETLVPRVDMCRADDGCISAIAMTMNKAVAAEA